MRRLLKALGIAALACLAVTQAAPSSFAAGTTPGGSPARSSAATIDTLSYFQNTHGVALSGSHSMSQYSTGNNIYLVKWDSDAYEHYTYDNNYIYLTEDHSGGEAPDGSYTYSDARWMARQMAVGQSIDVSANMAQFYDVGDSSCTPSHGGFQPYTMTLVAHDPDYQTGGTLGTQDVIVLQYDYRDGTGDQYERNYYAKGWGLVKWEWYQNDQVIATSTFQNTTTTPPTVPDTANSCVGTPVTNPVAPVPTSLTSFVTGMYSCILNNADPATSEVDNWVSQLQNDGLSISQAYNDFWNSQPSSVSDGDFANDLYRCMLHRDPDPTSYQNIVTGLQNGTVTRAGLVRQILSSQEFAVRILPMLQAVQYPPPNLPSSLSGFVSELYSCILSTPDPDTAGFDYWLGELQNKQLTIQGAYTSFWGYQASSVTNDQFANQAYGCMLFRTIDPGAYQNVLTRLDAGTLTRAGLVQQILSSQEFTGNILPTLQGLS
ncbi:MAG TPA: DUF4214 domain-containing protein [Pseudonocardiaceae bacterium]|jgi:hypothetical protein|nr:DUF4214 domain-containing protein [Pseudonocardiaceae bacterium]